jgi:hypothetical protein
MIGRVALAAAIVALTLHQASAQFGGMPGLPGGPQDSVPRDFGVPPPECQQLLTIRDQVQKAGQAIEAANQKKAHVKQACQLFRSYLAAETMMIEAMESLGSRCGVPPEILRQVRAGHAKAQQIGKQVCEVAARRPGLDGQWTWDEPIHNVRKPDDEDDCNLCWKKGDFWWLDRPKRR